MAYTILESEYGKPIKYQYDSAMFDESKVPIQTVYPGGLEVQFVSLLPEITEEEIYQAAEESFPQYPDDGEGGTLHDTFYEQEQEGFVAGAKWVLDKIKKELSKTPIVEC